MKALVLVAAVAALPAVAVFSGCASGGSSEMPREIRSVQYTLASGRTFESVVIDAATRRRWLPQKLANGTMRCTLEQREHRVVADVVPMPGGTFDIRCVESNIRARKYNQWADNLCREIVFRANR